MTDMVKGTEPDKDAPRDEVDRAWIMFWGREASFRDRVESTGAMERAFRAGYNAAIREVTE